MNKNFTIVDNYAIEHESDWFDIHNNYSIKSIFYDPANRSLTFNWVKKRTEVKGQESFMLKFNGVSILKINGILPSEKNNNDVTLSYLGYLHPNDLDLMNGCLMENEANSSYHLVCGFENGLFIKVFSNTAEVVVL